jgi:hypothetical protein
VRRLSKKEDEETCNLSEEWVFEFSKEGEENMKMSLLGAGMAIDVDLSTNGGGRSSNSTINSPIIIEDEESNNTQPAQLEIARQEQAEVAQKGKKGNKQIQWGPVIPLRRSARHAEDGRIMMEKAQEAKRKWNLDDKTGNKKPTNLSKNHLLSIAKEISLVGMDENPNLVDDMLDLDSSRTAASRINCSLKLQY